MITKSTTINNQNTSKATASRVPVEVVSRAASKYPIDFSTRESFPEIKSAHPLTT